MGNGYNCCQNENVTQIPPSLFKTTPEHTFTHDNQPFKSASIKEAKAHNEAAISHIRQVSVNLHSFISSGKSSFAEPFAIGKPWSGPTKLSIIVVVSNILKKGTRWELTPMGLENSQRNGNDGHVFFGSKKRAQVEGIQNKGPIINDIVIPVNNAGQQEKNHGNHFVIWNEGGYFRIKDLAMGHGVFLKIKGRCALSDNMLIHVGESYFVVNLIETESAPQRLRVKLFGGPWTGEIRYYNADEYTGCHLALGRSKMAEIGIEDNHLSKVQLLLTFKKGNWILIDGDGKRPSTNGTWLYISQETAITDKMQFKYGQTLLQAIL